MSFDYASRLGKLQALMKTEGLDAFVVSTQDGIYYLSGASYQPVERPFFILVKQEGPYDLIVPYLEFAHMKKVSGFGSISYYFEFPTSPGQNWYDVLNAALSSSPTVAVEPGLSLGMSKKLQVKELVVSDALSRLRMIKEAAEIAAIRNAARWTDKGMHLLHDSIYPGCAVIETVTYAKKLQTGLIATGEYDYLNCSFLTAGWPAPKSAQPHSVPDFHLRLGSGPIVLMSYNRVNGYAAECERTVFLGKPSPRDVELYNLVMEARALAYSMVRPGVPCADIDAATQNFFQQHGYKDKIIHRTGHGIGLGNHEQPWLSVGGEDVLAENMVISIEPALYFDDIGGFRHSDTVLVTKDGYEILTSYPSDLEHLVVSGLRPLQKLKGAIMRKAIHF